MTVGEVQLGKNGITPNFIKTLGNHFDKHHTVKVAVLKSAGHDKVIVKKLQEELLSELGPYYTAKIIGFKIIVKKWRKPRR